MNSHQDDPAFPVESFLHPSGQVENGTTGMDLRTYIATAALPTVYRVFVESGAVKPERVASLAAEESVRLASALIAELNRKEGV